MKTLVVDLDDTICSKVIGEEYCNAHPNLELIEKLMEYKKLGFRIVINTSRNMRTYRGNIGEINKYTLPVIVQWLNEHLPFYDEIYVGKPWCGFEGFYIDDRAVRPSEFIKNSYSQILEILAGEK
jgi:capsule biosynthesis phosphatase